jgi:acyl-CoA thioesterase
VSALVEDARGVLSDTSTPVRRRKGFAELLGLRHVSRSAGMSRYEVDAGEEHFNPNGVVHGGLAFALADTGTGSALWTLLARDEGCATIEMKISYLKPAKSGHLVCDSRVLHREGNIATIESEVRSGDDLIARALAVYAIFPAALRGSSAGFGTKTSALGFATGSPGFSAHRPPESCGRYPSRSVNCHQLRWLPKTPYTSRSGCPMFDADRDAAQSRAGATRQASLSIGRRRCRCACKHLHCPRTGCRAPRQTPSKPVPPIGLVRGGRFLVAAVKPPWFEVATCAYAVLASNTL